jgi:hypothetical protein
MSQKDKLNSRTVHPRIKRDIAGEIMKQLEFTSVNILNKDFPSHQPATESVCWYIIRGAMDAGVHLLTKKR